MRATRLPGGISKRYGASVRCRVTVFTGRLAPLRYLPAKLATADAISCPTETRGAMDVVAFDPKTRKVVHIEPSMDAQSWALRTGRYEKKFEAARKHLPKLFDGLDIVESIEQIALFVFASNKVHQTIAGGTVMLVPELLQKIFQKLKDTSVARSAVSEQFGVIRTLQMVSEYRNVLFPPGQD